MNELIAAAVEFAESGKSRLLNTLKHVPDDKLDWTPSPTASSAMRIAAHAALSNRFFVGMLNGDPMPDIPMAEFFEQVSAAEKAVTTRAQVVELIEQGATDAIAALKRLTPERMASEVKTPFNTLPMTFVMLLVGRHMDDHASQIDYLQTIWGDADMHF